MNRLLALLALLLFISTADAGSANLNFTLHELNSNQPGPTMLVLGGIQGDEPGGFTAASLLVTHYRITHGNVWVIPNLNFLSIVSNSRGIYGDMNRKFGDLTTRDPEYATVSRIKKILLDLRIDVIVNLHDGSGWYAPEYVDKQRNPEQWGQSIIIDQATVAGSPFGNLAQIANQAVVQANTAISDPAHQFHVKNTRTWAGDEEMSKSLTYFAVRNHAPALAVEATKSFDTPWRVVHHLLAVEALMAAVGVQFERDFGLTIAAVKEAMGENLRLSLNDQRVTLNLENPRKSLPRFPMPKGTKPSFSASNPLVALTHKKNLYQVTYGNRTILEIQPQFVEFDDSLASVAVTADGKARRVSMGAMVGVKERFTVKSLKPYRVSVVGYRHSKRTGDAGATIARQDLMKKYSLDAEGSKYRVEFYNGKKFAGMVIVDFANEGQEAIPRHDASILDMRTAAAGS